MSRIVNIVLILIGGAVALYAQAEETQNVYILIGGIFLLMLGLYRLSRGISDISRNENESFVKHEEEE